MKIELDVHTHTIASGHAFSSLQEMARAAADRGLKLLGITEHTPGIPGSCHLIYFRNLHVVPRQMYGIELLLGAEINILDTQGMIKAIENPYTHIISHPGDGTAKLLFEPIVQAAKAHHTLLEINNSSLKPCRNKVEARPNNLEILRLCKQYEVPVILGSDAHISFDIATYDHALELVKETEFPESLILNTDVARFKQYLHLDK